VRESGLLWQHCCDTPCYPLLPPATPRYPLLPLATSCHPLLPLATPTKTLSRNLVASSSALHPVTGCNTLLHPPFTGERRNIVATKWAKGVYYGNIVAIPPVTPCYTLPPPLHPVTGCNTLLHPATPTNLLPKNLVASSSTLGAYPLTRGVPPAPFRSAPGAPVSRPGVPLRRSAWPFRRPGVPLTRLRVGVPVFRPALPSHISRCTARPVPGRVYRRSTPPFRSASGVPFRPSLYRRSGVPPGTGGVPGVPLYRCPVPVPHPSRPMCATCPALGTRHQDGRQDLEGYR